MPSLSRRTLLVLGGFGAFSLATDLGCAPAQAATPELSLDFESGSLGAPLTGSGGAHVGKNYAHTGNFGCRLDPSTTGRRCAYLTVDRRGFALKQPYATFIMFFRLVTDPNTTDNYMNLFEIGNTGTSAPKSQFTVFFRDGDLMCDFNWSESMRIDTTPSLGDWHMIQAVVNYGSSTYTAHVSLDGAPAKTLTSADNKKPQSVRALWLHYSRAAVDYIMDVDDIRMVTSTSEPGFLPPPGASAPPAPPPPAVGAVATFRESFEGGASGIAPTSGNTSYDQAIGDRGVSNGTVAAQFASDGLRGRCVRFYNTRVASSTFGFLGKRVGPTKTLYLRRYYKLDRLPPYRTSVLLYKFGGNGNGQLGGTHNGSFAFGGNRQSNRFTLVDNNTNTTVSKAVVPVDRWFRVETKVDFSSGSGLQTVRLFLGSNVNGTVPDETLQARLTGSYTDYVEDGILTNPNVLVNVKIDEAVNASDWPGPAR